MYRCSSLSYCRHLVPSTSLSGSATYVSHIRRLGMHTSTGSAYAFRKSGERYWHTRRCTRRLVLLTAVITLLIAPTCALPPRQHSEQPLITSDSRAEQNSTAIWLRSKTPHVTWLAFGREAAASSYNRLNRHTQQLLFPGERQQQCPRRVRWKCRLQHTGCIIHTTIYIRN